MTKTTKNEVKKWVGGVSAGIALLVGIIIWAWCVGQTLDNAADKISLSIINVNITTGKK